MFVSVLINHNDRDYTVPHEHDCKNCVVCSYNAALIAVVLQTNIWRSVCWETQGREGAHLGFNAGPTERR